MKVAFLLPRFPSLSGTFILNQITGLLDRGHDVEIWAYTAEKGPQHPDIERYALLSRVRYRNATPRNFLMRYFKAFGLCMRHIWQYPRPLIRSLNILRYGRSAMSLDLFYSTISMLPQHHYDIIHCHFGPSGNLGVALCEIGVLKGAMLTTFYGHDVTRFPKQIGKGCYRRLFATGTPVLVLSQVMHGRLKLLGASERQISLHPLGVNCQCFRFRPRSISDSEPVRIITVGRMVEKKGFEYAIRAVAMAKKMIGDDASIDFVMIGDGPLRHSLEGLVVKLNLGDTVHMLGARDQVTVLREMDKAHLFLLPSVVSSCGDEEGTPTAILEALAMGLPVISTYHSGIPEQVQDGRSGYLSPERDVDSLSRHLVYLIRHPDLWPDMGRAGRSHVEKNYNAVHLSEKLLCQYKSLLA